MIKRIIICIIAIFTIGTIYISASPDADMPEIKDLFYQQLNDQFIIRMQVYDDSGIESTKIIYDENEYGMICSDSKDNIYYFNISLNQEIVIDEVEIVIKDINENVLIKKLVE